jgi:hypothetical protein
MTTGGPFEEWDEFDFLAAGGMLVLTGSVVASLFPHFRKIGLLFPIGIGAAMMVVAAYGARYGEGETTTGESDKANPPWLVTGDTR